MGRLKTFRKYILWLLGFMLFSYIITFVGLNATYKNIKTPNDIPEGVNVVMAQSTKVNGRIYGDVTSTNENNLNGKYLKVDIFDRRSNLCGTKYLKLENLEENISKKFAVNFTAENIKYYTIDLLEDKEELEYKIIEARRLYKDVFTEDELKGLMILSLVTALAFGF